MATAREAKKILRKELKRQISIIPEKEKIRQSEFVTQKLLSHPIYQQSRRISVYLCMPEQEINTDGILQHMFNNNKICFVPQYIGPNMKMLRMYSMEDYASLPKTKWNIKQPAENDEREDALETGGLDLIVVPGLGFTKDGDRLGRGKGYYDAYQDKARRQGKLYTIALAFKEQICDEIPVTDHDVKVDVVLYGDMDEV